MMDIDTSRNYATEANLEAALAKLGFASHRHVVVCTRNGRFTAIFPASNLNSGPHQGDMTLYARHGFFTLG